MIVTDFDRRDSAMLLSLFKMALNDRFLGSRLGMVWALLSPLFLMGIFCFVFTVVFPGRLPGREGVMPFVIWLISGYGSWLGISEGLSSATSSVTGNAGIVKNIAFKSELLPVVGSLLGLVPLCVGLAMTLLLTLAAGEPLNPEILILPLVIFLQLVLISGLGMFLAALNVFVRDTALALPSILTMMLFASPIFYPLEAYPDFIQPVFALNPFYVLSECYRAPIIAGRLPDPWMLGYLVAVSGILLLAGLWWFRRLKPFFDSRL